MHKYHREIDIIYTWVNGSDDAYVTLNYGICLAKLEKYPEAETAIRQSISMNPSLPDAHRALGFLYCQVF